MTSSDGYSTGLPTRTSPDNVDKLRGVPWTYGTPIAIDPCESACNRAEMNVKRLSELGLVPHWVSPRHRVDSAVILVEGHRARALGVLEGYRLVGLVTRLELATASKDAYVETVMSPARFVAEATWSVRKLAGYMSENGLDLVPVVEGDRFLGIVSATDLLEELGRSYDPLTGLAWSDELRQWGVESLKAGTELTVIFCDLDEFGEYNKRFGHVIGDRVLVQVAAFLQSYVDPARDLLVRYGGDEFVFATLRPRPEAVQLAEEFQSGLLLHDVPTESGSLMSVGIAGGRRTVERENVHFMATLDNLINTASRESTLKKREKAQAARPSSQLEGEAQTPGATPAPIPTAKAPMAVVEVHADDTQVHGLTTVILSRGDALISGVQSRSGRSAVESIALATAKALDRAFPGVRVVVKDVRLIERPGGTRIVEVVGSATHSGVESEISGTCEAGADVFRAVAQATLQSVLDLLG